LEEHLLANRDLLPNLIEINGVSVDVKGKEEREVERNILKIMKNIWMFNGSYRLAKENKIDESSIWYVPDEVGCAVAHSDQPNCVMMPFIYSPANSFTDENTITYSVLWPVMDLHENDMLYRDNLYKIDESKFRSSRLGVWYDTPEQYFKDQLKIYKEGSQLRQEVD
jgi:tubulin--tyrosine ligase-like protein 12